MTWQVVGASAQGASHVERDIVCQDAFAYALVGQGTLIAAVADGAGSAKLSHIGSELAATAVVERLQARLAKSTPDAEDAWQDLMREGFEHALDELLDRAENESHEARLLATTLTCVVVTDTWLVAGQVGDGLAIAEGPEEALHTLIDPQRGEFVNQTVFLTSTDALDDMEILARRARVEHVALSTDGLANASTHHPDFRPSEGFFAPLFAFAASTEGAEATAQLEAFLNREALDRLTQDDKTLLVAVRTASDPGVVDRVVNALRPRRSRS